jgi:hypothetical protein
VADSDHFFGFNPNLPAKGNRRGKVCLTLSVKVLDDHFLSDEVGGLV